MSGLGNNLETHPSHPLTYQAGNRFSQEGGPLKVPKLVNIDSRIQMVCVLWKCLFNVSCGFSDRPIDLFLCLRVRVCCASCK